MSTNPITQFAAWFARASKCGIDKPHAMTLSTVGADGRPTARMVLLSSFDERGFVFHTNYESDKARAMAVNPNVALVLWWDPLGLQVRIDGRVEKTNDAESQAYFAKRPRGSQLGAWASNQSRTISGYAELEERLRELQAQYRDRVVPRPPHWGGYRVVPNAIEFWQHRDDRLHHRVRFERDAAGAWRSRYLAP